MGVSDLPNPAHPFYPVETLLTGFIANDKGVLELLLTFAVGCVVIVGSAHALARRYNPNMTTLDKCALGWFVMSKFYRGLPYLTQLYTLSRVHKSLWKEEA